MPQDIPSPPAERVSRLKSKRAQAIGVFLIILLLLHRPLLRTGIAALLQFNAQQNGLKLEVQIYGDVLSEITLTNLHVSRKDAQSPSIAQSSSLEEVQVRSATLQYNLWRLVERGPTACISSFTAEGVWVKVWAESETPQNSARSNARGVVQHPAALLLRRLVALSTSPIRLVRLEDVNLNIDGGPSVFSVQGGELLVKRGRTGKLRVAALQLGSDAKPRQLEAVTQYDKGVFVLGELALTPEMHLKELRLDASKVQEGTASASLSAQCGEGELHVQFLASHLGSRFHEPHWEAEISTDSLNFNHLTSSWMPAALPLPVITGKAHLEGNPKRAESWQGTLDASGTQALLGSGAANVGFYATLASGSIQIQALELRSEHSTATASGTIQLPEVWTNWKAIRAEVAAHVTTNDCGEWYTPSKNFELNCKLESDAKLHFSHGAVQIESATHLDSVQFGALHLEHAQVEATLAIPLLHSFKREELAGNAAVSLTQPSWKGAEFGVALTQASTALTVSDGILRLWNINLRDTQNTVRGEILWPISESAGTGTINLDIDCSALEATELQLRGKAVTGALQGRVSGSGSQGAFETACTILGSNVRWGEFGPFDLQMQTASSGNAVVVQGIRMEFGSAGQLEVKGDVNLATPFAYQVDTRVDFSKMDTLHPLMAQLGFGHSLSGTLKGAWKGEGTLADLNGQGDWSVQIRDASWDKVKLKVLDCNGHYVPGNIIAETFRVETQDTRCSAQANWSGTTLQIQNLTVEQWRHPALTGFLTLPLAHDEKGIRWVETGKLEGKIQATKLDLANLCANAGKPGMLQGSVALLFELGGTPTRPSATFRLDASGLQSAELLKFAPLSLMTSGTYANGVLQGDATLRTPLDAPVEIHVTVPVPFAELLRGETKVLDLPLSGKVLTRNASLHILPQLWSGLRQINGTATLEADLSGSCGKPGFAGRFEARCPVVHFSSDRAPAMGDVKVGIEFNPGELRVKELKADLGGGNLQITGNAKFEEAGNPTLNFTAKAKEVLVVRNRELSLRLNGDLHLHGPWKRAVIDGQAAAVKSRWQKDVEVLPLTVVRSGFPKEQAQMTGKPWFTFQKKPFSDWVFNVALSSTPGDPILVRGNRLRGTADAEIRLEGTGAAPTLHGAYRTSSLIATLPFSRLEISHGRVWYTRDLPFQPQLDFSAETEVRNNRVRLYLWGPASAPSISAKSEPPLSEVDLLTLLTTGSLPGDASENSQALAGRAAALLFQEFSDKVLTPNGKQERFSALRRFSLDVGALNSRTGHQESRLSYRLLNDLFLIGEVGADGDFAGRVRYVMRFR